MRIFIIFALVAMTALLGLGLTTPASANCPPGYYQTSQTDYVGCAPLPSNGGAPAAPSGPQWASRYGAIAITNGAFGAANGMSSKRKAEKAAMKQCVANGGKACRIRDTYWNQCVALAWGDDLNSVDFGADKPQVEANAMARCSKSTKNCELYYSACSYAERIR
jgi:hypothetical protein